MDTPKSCVGTRSSYMSLLPCIGFLCGRIFSTGSTASVGTASRIARSRISLLPTPVLRR